MKEVLKPEINDDYVDLIRERFYFFKKNYLYFACFASYVQSISDSFIFKIRLSAYACKDMWFLKNDFVKFKYKDNSHAYFFMDKEIILITYEDLKIG
jgi:hypothetical protein